MVEDEADLKVIKGLNKESTISVEGTVRERASKNPKLPTGEIEVVPTKIEVLGRCRYNALPFEINRSREADETQRLKYRYLDLRNPAVKHPLSGVAPRFRRPGGMGRKSYRPLSEAGYRSAEQSAGLLR